MSHAQTGSVYTRWGRTTCAGGILPIYQGEEVFTVIDTGGRVNYQCISLRPEYEHNIRILKMEFATMIE